MDVIPGDHRSKTGTRFVSVCWRPAPARGCTCPAPATRALAPAAASSRDSVFQETWTRRNASVVSGCAAIGWVHHNRSPDLELAHAA